MGRVLLLFLLLVPISLFSQIRESLVVKVDSVLYQRQRIFVDNFVDNRFDWLHEGAGDLNRIQDGFLFYSNPFEFPYYDGKAIYFDPSQNFEIDTKIKFISGGVEDVNGLFWGDLVFGVKFLLGFSQMGDYVVIKNTGFDEKILGTTKVEINRSDFNRLTVRKIGQFYYFYINDTLIYKMNYTPFSGRYIGFFIAPKAYIQIAYLKVWKLIQKTKI